MSKRLAGCVAQRRSDWPSVQAARRSLRAFWTSPYGPALSVRILRPIVSTDSQSAFADGPAACERIEPVTLTQNESEHP